MKTMKYNKRAGISLVALVVTIIVLIILTAAVIVTFMEGGIVERAKEAVFKNDIRTYQEILALKKAEEMIEISVGTGKAGELNGTTAAEIQVFIPEFKDEYEGIITISNGEIMVAEGYEEVATDLQQKWLTDLGILSEGKAPVEEIVKGPTLASVVSVGDYVKYEPQTTTISVSVPYTESGYFEDDAYWESDIDNWIDQTINQESLNWRVLKNDGTTVTLVSATPTTEQIGFGGGKAYLNAPDILDNTYATLYSSDKGTARSIDVEDINSITGYEVPTTWQDTEGNTYSGTIGEAASDLEWGYCSVPAGKYEDYTPDYYSYKIADYINSTNILYNILFSSNVKYWLASNCLVVYQSSAQNDLDFGVRAITYYNNVCEVRRSGTSLGYGEVYADKMSGRPIVILNTGLTIDEATSGDGSSASSAWVLQ